MKLDIQTKQPETPVDASKLPGEELLVTIGDYKNSDGSIEVPAGSLFLSLWGNLVGFLPNGEFRFWSESTLRLTPSAVCNHLQFRRALPGEGLTLSA